MSNLPPLFCSKSPFLPLPQKFSKKVKISAKSRSKLFYLNDLGGNQPDLGN
jgi:hypothetical protein